MSPFIVVHPHLFLARFEAVHWDCGPKGAAAWLTLSLAVDLAAQSVYAGYTGLEIGTVLGMLGSTLMHGVLWLFAPPRLNKALAFALTVVAAVSFCFFWLESPTWLAWAWQVWSAVAICATTLRYLRTPKSLMKCRPH